MQLSKKNVSSIRPVNGLTVPNENLFRLPEKVLQFGTGVLLRGLPDYFIDKANRQGVFNGRVVVVKSTSQGSADAFDQQDCLYTQHIKGIEKGMMKEEAIINSSISRVLSAKEQWKDILACASNPDMRIIISNTTEVGIVLTEDDVRLAPPASFPGKLLAFLLGRYTFFNGSEESGMVIIPTELITDNGTKLKAIVLELAVNNKLDEKFIQWLQSANYFCNSLVDRIVPGKLPAAESTMAEKQLGYKDDLAIMSETFRLWAIESSSEKVREILSFSQADEGVVIAADIEKFRELKLRLLNGTHTFSCGLAYLAGFETVKEAMGDSNFAGYVRRLMMLEIAPAIASETITYNEACAFANQVSDRFRNPALDHKWISITMNYTSKMKMRNVPLLLGHYEKSKNVPAEMALGFAAYLLFMKCKAAGDNSFVGELKGRTYSIQDDTAAYFAENWSKADIDTFVNGVLSNTKLWGTDLTRLSGFSAAVKEDILKLDQQGAEATLAGKQLKTVV